jgi:hypothetical protein
MVELFPEARKFHLGITLAHQYLDQLTKDLRHAILGNVGTMVVFRVGARDAGILAQEFSPRAGGAEAAGALSDPPHLCLAVAQTERGHLMGDAANGAREYENGDLALLEVYSQSVPAGWPGLCGRNKASDGGGVR